MAVKHPLCKPDDIDDPGSMGFDLQHGDTTVQLFVVRRDGQFFGYLNHCPHTGVNLEWLENQFLDMDKAFIQCATHNALFEIDSGRCIAGPCTDESLQAVELQATADTLYAVLD